MQNETPPITTQVQNETRDVDGTVLITTTNGEISVVQPDGSLQIQRGYQAIVLVDDTIWNPSIAARAENPIDLAVCRTCRRGTRASGREEAPTHGLMAAQNAQRCPDCGELCCPKHQKRGYDNVIRCWGCDRRLGILDWLYDTFFGTPKE